MNTLQWSKADNR